MDTSKPKPDLMGASPASAGSGKRILAHLEHGAKPAAKPVRISTAGWTIDRWTVGLVFLLFFISSVAWMVREQTVPQSSALRHDTSETRTPEATARQEDVQPEASPAELAEQPTGATTQATSQAAAIINEAVQAPMPVQAAAATSTVPAEVATASMQPSSPTAPTPLARAEHPRPAAPAARKQTTGATGANDNTTRASAAATRTPGDTDVALLTALVAHANKPTVVTPERNRDVVERQETDTTAQLLARCKQLGLIEGMLCRSRICSGRWEADAACRAPAH